MELFINKISHYLPDSVVPNSYFKEVNGLDDEWIYSRTGIKNRSTVPTAFNDFFFIFPSFCIVLQLYVS